MKKLQVVKPVVFIYTILSTVSFESFTFTSEVIIGNKLENPDLLK